MAFDDVCLSIEMHFGVRTQRRRGWQDGVSIPSCELGWQTGTAAVYPVLFHWIFQLGGPYAEPRILQNGLFGVVEDAAASSLQPSAPFLQDAWVLLGLGPRLKAGPSCMDPSTTKHMPPSNVHLEKISLPSFPADTGTRRLESTACILT